MLFISMFSPEGYETVRVPDEQLEAEIGNALRGRPVLRIRSGWLYAAEGVTLWNGEQKMPDPLDITASMSLTLQSPEGQAALAIRYTEERTAVLNLAGVDSFSVGRASANTLVYKDLFVSGCHGRFSRSGTDGFVYTDLSTNGSFVDGQYVKNVRVPVPDGTEVLIPPLLKIVPERETLRLNYTGELKQCQLTEVKGAPAE